MMQVARIDDQVISAEDFVKSLTFHGLMDDMIENLMSERLTVIEAKKQGIRVGDDELQERADQLRRVQGLHRQKDTLDWLESMGLSVDEFEQFLLDGLYKEKMLATITSDEAIEEYFKLNSPKFEAVELSHIMVDSEAKARELVAYLNDEPEDFEFLLAYSPYHNVKPGTEFPPTMVTTADTDDRVVPMHSFKFAAALQEAQAAEDPILLRVELKAGHGAGTPISKRIDEVADTWAFLADVFDMKVEPVK